MVIYHIDMVILDIDMEYGLMIWEMTVSIQLSLISIWDILSLYQRDHSFPDCLLMVHWYDTHSFRQSHLLLV